MATCDAETLLASAATNGFTKLSYGDALSVLVTLAQDWEGGSDTAATLLAAAAQNEYLFLNDASIWDCICQKLCDISSA
jgi:hypothetical protein